MRPIAVVLDEVHAWHSPEMHHWCVCQGVTETLGRIERQFGIKTGADRISYKSTASRHCSPCGTRLCLWCGGIFWKDVQKNWLRRQEMLDTMGDSIQGILDKYASKV